VETVILGILGPALGFLGVVIGIWYGRKTSREGRHDQRNEFYRTRRKEAYAGLWEVVQDAHLKMRASLKADLSELPGFLVDVNSFLWKNGIYIDPADRDLTQEYLFLVYEFLRTVSWNSRAKEWTISSIAMPDNLPSTLEIMKVAQEAADDVRDQLIARIRIVLGATPNQVSSAKVSVGHKLTSKFNEMVRQDIASREPRLTGDTREWRPVVLPKDVQPPGWGELNDDWI
jgi:hypothetical protein